VKDILGGKKYLLRQDDLVVTTTAEPISPGFSQTRLATLFSSNSNLAYQGNIPWNFGNYGANNFITTIGRMYNLSNDVVATFAQTFTGLGVNIYDPHTGAMQFTASPAPSAQGMSLQNAVMADFSGDGYADIATLTSYDGNSQSYLTVASSADVNQISSGLKFGPVAAVPLFAQLAVGDFDGNGQPEIVVGSCPGPNCSIQVYSVDPSSLVLTAGASVTLPGFSDSGLTLAAGRFGAMDHDQLVVIYTDDSQSGNLVVTTVDFDSNLKPVIKANFDTGIGDNGFLSPIAQTARLDWSSPYDKLVFVPSPQSNPSLSILTFSQDGNLTPSTLGPGLSLTQSPCVTDLAVGNFNHTVSNPTPPPATTVDPTLQIAVLFPNTCSASPSSVGVLIFDVSPSTYALTLDSNFTIPAAGLPPLPSLNLNLAAGDLQGRSWPLGQAEKLSVSGHVQPDTILGLPPMHVDWITPVGSSAAEIFNVSVFPVTFNTKYNYASNSTGTASRKAATSYTLATKESAEEKISYGIPDVASVGLTLKQAASQTHQDTVSTTYNTYQGNSFTFTAQTTFDDLVAATSTQFNVYSYQVLGQCLPASGASALDGCPAGTKPLHVQFSGPDNVDYIQLSGGVGLEWYQPVHEPGNLFSYPGTLGLLQANQPAVTAQQLLSASNDLWDSQSSTQVTVTWNQGGGQDATSGSVCSHTFDASVSASGSVNIEGFGLSASAGFDYNQSQSMSTLNTSTNSNSTSNGVVINRGVGGGPASSSNYLYAGQSFIFGQSATTGTIQDDLNPGTSIQAQGFLSVGYAADPTSTGGIQSGNWWRQAYGGSPDIALNHPQRWMQSTPLGSNPQQVWFNCPVGFTSSPGSPACAPTPEVPTPQNVTDALFYQMKGLFVSPGATPGGPQITSIPQGQTVALQVRVYNYSLANLPEGSTVHARFYAQPWDPQLGQFQSAPNNPKAFAPATLISESDVQLAPIPAFCGGLNPDDAGDPCTGDNPPQNWVFAQTTWDTSKVTPNTNWKFWVVVWAEQNGQLIPEIGDHGLTALPLASLNSLADVPVQTYSNNLGFYNQVFTVTSPPSAAAAAVKFDAGEKRLSIDRLQASPTQALLNRTTVVRATHRSGGAAFGPVITHFFDGDPRKSGKLFDLEHIPAISPGAEFVTPAFFRPQTCGRHRIYAQAVTQDGSAPPVLRSGTVTVTADFPAEFATLKKSIRTSQISHRLKKRLLLRVDSARQLLDRNHEGAAKRILRLMQREINALSDSRISRADAHAWTDEIKLIRGCILRQD